MNSKVYKWCAVPQCVNTTIKTPNKVFVHVPHNKTVRHEWLTLARRDPTSVTANSPIYFCEDHFDLPNDMENYMQYKLMGSVGQVRMKPGCMPTKYECQPDRKSRTPNPIERPFILKKRRMMAIEDSIKDLEERRMVTKLIEQEEDSSGSSVQPTEVHLVSRENKTLDKSVQVYITRKFRSKAIQTELKLVNRMSSPLKPDLKSVSTSPFKIQSSCRIQPSRPGINVQKNLFRKDEQSVNDTSYTPSVVYTGSSPSFKSFQMESTSDCSETFEDDMQREAIILLQSTMKIITKNPRRYIGVPVDCYFLINLIQEQTNIPLKSHFCV